MFWDSQRWFLTNLSIYMYIPNLGEYLENTKEMNKNQILWFENVIKRICDTITYSFNKIFNKYIFKPSDATYSM